VLQKNGHYRIKHLTRQVSKKANQRQDPDVPCKDAHGIKMQQLNQI
jgi:hypothetical protein